MNTSIKIGQLLEITGGQTACGETDAGWTYIAVITNITDKEYVILDLHDLSKRRFAKKDYQLLETKKSAVNVQWNRVNRIAYATIKNVKKYFKDFMGEKKKAKRVIAYFKKNTLRNLKGAILSERKLKNLLKQVNGEK